VTDWIKYQSEIRTAFRKDGVEATIKRKSFGEYDVVTGESAETTSESEVVYAFIKSSNFDNEPIASDEIIIMSSAPSDMDISFPENHYIELKNKEYTINRVKAVAPGGEPIFYKLICKL